MTFRLVSRNPIAPTTSCWQRAGRWLVCALVVLLDAPTLWGQDPASEEFFEKRIRPVLAGNCFRCHGGLKVSGGLRVDSREALVKGGESGAAIDLNKPQKSLLLAAMKREESVSAMPPDKPLADAQIVDIAAWLAAGAPWPKQAGQFEAAPHWAFQPLVHHPLPKTQNDTWSRTSIDAFILAELEKAGREPAPAADRRTLLRRLSYDLTGLPPTAAEVAAFENDHSPQAYEKVVERLLASPAYGEQWGRHWLDVVRYADTAGENSDHPLPHAWRYRNWVIDAFNRDLPYDQFLREQVAGDLLAKQGPEELAEGRIVATGYLAISRRFGHDIDQDMHLTLEDTLDTLGKSVLGLSIGCCRCHDHKFDPLTVQDYYSLYGIFASTTFPFPGCEPKQQPRDLVSLPLPASQLAQLKAIETQLSALDTEASEIASTHAAAAKKLQTALASATTLLARGEIDDSKEATLVSGKVQPLDKIPIKRGDTLLLSVAPRGNHGADSTLVELEIVEAGGQSRTWSTTQLINDLVTSNPHADAHGHASVWAFLDLQAAPQLLPEKLYEINGLSELQGWRNGDTPSVFVNRSDAAVKVWTVLPPRTFFVHPGPQGPVGVAWVSPIDGTIGISGRIADAHPAGPDGIAWELTKIAGAEFSIGLAEQSMHQSKLAEFTQRKQQLEKLRPTAPLAYAVREGTAGHAKIHKRGEPTDLGDEAPRKFLDVLGGAPLQDTRSSGRLELSQWLTAANNPLTPRVIANRVWQRHFGRGLVITPNDFGTRGAPPTHPQLLDHLASELIRSGWSLKDLHRRIVLSATYQQAAGNADEIAFYGAFARRRLTAEELRDTLLVAGGDLDRSAGGPHPFPPESTWSFTQHAPFAAEYDTNRRSVYVMQKRNRRHRFFALFDGADPNSSTATREVTTVPTQALYFLNDPLIHAQAAKLAARAFASSDQDRQRIGFLYQELLGRTVRDEELRDAETFLAEYAATLTDRREAERVTTAWQAYARVLVSSSEVLHVD